MGFAIRFQEIFSSRFLIKTFLMQDIKVKYRGSYLVFAWMLLQPVLMMAVMTVAFSFMFGRASNYTLHLFATLLPWMCMSRCLDGACRSMISSQNLLRQYYFCRLLCPLRPIFFCRWERRPESAWFAGSCRAYSKCGDCF